MTNATPLHNELPAAFAARMQKLLSPDDYAAYLDALERPPLRLARKNPLKPVSDDLLIAETGGYPLLPETAKPGKGALHAAGAYYVQEPAAAAVANILPPLLPPHARVLDMCAAPGGKVTATACAKSDGVFVANEYNFSRAKILLGNVERMGLRNTTVTSLFPDEIAARCGGLFDAVIADVPCSGEGMLRKTTLTTSDVSDESVAACAARAARILNACHACLREGGLLLFSTCTFNTTENEQQVFRLIREYGYEPVPIARPPHAREGFSLPQAVRFFPQDGGGEGHFACLLRKTATATPATVKREKYKPNAFVKQTLSLLADITRERFYAERTVAAGDGCEYLPPDYPFAALPALRRGVRLGTATGNRIVPHHHFAVAADPALLIDAPDFAPDAPQLRAYLSGESFACDGKNGFRVLTVAHLPLGLIKITDGTAKNHYPKGLRLPF